MKRKRINKLRGSRTCGKGRNDRNRNKGTKGGKGFAGSKEHKKQMILTADPDHFGKKGFTVVRKKKSKYKNISDLQRMGLKEIDLPKHKILGVGSLNIPLTVKAQAFSKNAKEKIEKAGGKAVLRG